MKRLVEYADYRLNGDRILEMGWIREMTRALRNKDIADFGGVIRTTYGPRLGHSSYSLDESNTVTVYDVEDAPQLEGMYTRIDLLDMNILPEKKHQIGICVSALEHFGLEKYRSEHRMPDGDYVGLHNIWRSVSETLYLTIPAGRGIIMNGWIREYSPHQLDHLLKSLPGCWYTVQYFFWDSNLYWYEVNAATLVNEKNKEPQDATITTGLACVVLNRK